MAPSRTIDPRAGVRQPVDRIYAVNSTSSSPHGRCSLDDGSAVICAFETAAAAKEASANDSTLRLVRHQSLSPQEQKRVARALLT